MSRPYEDYVFIFQLLEPNKPQQLCRICHALMKTLYIFTTKAIKSDQLLTQMLRNRVLLSRCKFTQIDRKLYSTMYLTTSPVETISIDPGVKDTGQTVKNEARVTNGNNVPTGIGGMLDVIVKTEVPIEFSDGNGEFQEPDLTLYKVPPKSDSEDDVPLTNMRLESQKRRKVNGADTIKVEEETVERGRRKKDRTEIVKSYAREIILTKEQQMEELRDREKSMNYINSPYKCDVCFKGFLVGKAFDNHRVKHEKKSGKFKCEICGIRYRSGRLLRSHAAQAHLKRYECVRCLHRSHTVDQARDHERWHNGYTYECKLCGHKFSKPTSYLTHKRKHHPTQHVCTLCGDGFISILGLQMHCKKAHARDEIPENPTEPAAERFCTDCSIQFVTKEAWKRHMLVSKVHVDARTSGSSLECRICSAVLPSAAALTLHTRSHERALLGRHRVRPEVPTATCDQCSRQFRSRARLLAHVKRVHLGIKYIKDIVCEHCGRKCATNASLVSHQRTHTGERPYHCDTCQKGFADTNQLKIHTRVHTGERPYSCNVCEKRFRQKPALNRHFRIHTGAKPYTCQLCSKTFTQSNSLKLHMRTVHLKIPVHRKRGVRVNTDNGGQNQSKADDTPA